MSQKSDSRQAPPLAVIGIGCLFPKAGSLGEYWANIKNKVDAITEVPPSHWSPEDYYDQDPKRPDFTYARKGGFLLPVEFDPAEFGISPNTLEATDSAQLLGLVAARMALQDAGYGPERDYDRSRVSVILGVTGTLGLVIPLGARLGHPIWRKALKEAGIENDKAEGIIDRIKEGYVPWQENSFPGLLGNVVAGRIANRFNLGGTNCVVDAACASSLSAMHLASLELSQRRSAMVVTGGADCFNDIFMFMCFSKTPALSPSGEIRPFDQSADGTALGEGLGMIVLKRLDEAEKDGDKIYAVLKGVGSSSDGRGKAIYAPSSEGQTKALREAYRVSGVSPATVELVEAHGTGTTVGDGAEVEALTEVFKESFGETNGKGGTPRPVGPWCGLGSVKSMIGHTKAAAGSAGLIKAVLALHHKVLPPTIKVNNPIGQVAREGSPFYLNTEKRPWLGREHPRRAAVSALGFGGSNFHAVLEEYRPQKTEIDWDGQVQVVAISGTDIAALQKNLLGWSGELAWDSLRVKAMESRSAFRAADEYRLCFVVEKDKTDLGKLVSTASVNLEQKGGQASWSLPEGIFFGRGTPGKLAALFPGQGSQYVGMGRDIACQFPKALETLAEGDRAFGQDPRLSDFIYPRPVFTDDGKSAQEAELRATQVAQPALGAVSLAAYRVLSDFGVSPQAVAGHSYGELAALCAADVIEPKDLFAFSKLRGELMASGKGDRGGMLAVQAPLDEIERALKEEKLGLSVANKNAPRQSVLSGPTEEIRRASEVMTRRGLKNVALPVSAAFHSPLVAGALKPFLAALQRAEFRKAGIAVYSNTTGGVYPFQARDSRDLLASQLASPVEFAAMIEKMHASGVRTFLEVGPGARLTGLVQAILAGRAFEAMALDSSSGRRSGILDMARALSQLAACGHPIRLPLWEGGEEGVRSLVGGKKPKMAVTLTGANYRSQKPQLMQPSVLPHAAPKTDAKDGLPNPAAPPAALPTGASFLAQALKATQESINALQKLQEQTAGLHERFLESQEAVQRSFQSLIDQQQSLFAQTMGSSQIQSQGLMPAPAVPSISPPASTPFLRTPRTACRILPPTVSVPRGTPPAAVAAKLEPAQKPIAAEASRVEKVLLGVVSEKTGYPVETLNPDMDMESDLGIDSIKRVEILSALGEKLPEAPKVKPEHLGTLRTLRQIEEFLMNGLASAGAPIPGGNAASAVLPAESRPAVAGIEAVLLSVVSEKTGYPIETLNPDMDMESDLGIDSIKRVEILSALQEKLPEAPKVKPEHLGTLRSLRQIADFLSAGSKEQKPETAPVVPQGSKPPSVAPGVNVLPKDAEDGLPNTAAVGVRRLVLRAADIPDAARAALALKDGLIWVSDDGSALCRELVESLKARGCRAQAVSLENPGRLTGGLSGLVLLAPPRRLDPEGLWDQESEGFLKKAFRLAQIAGPALRSAGRSGSAVFITVSRLDGSFGLAGLASDQDPVMGGLAGLCKTAGREWPEVHAKAVDAAADWREDQALAEALAAEIFLSGPSELGLSVSSRKVLELEESPHEGEGKISLREGDAVIVTGGARGVTAEAAVALALACRPTLILLGRSPAPGEEPEWLGSCRGEAEIQRAILGRAAGKMTPKKLGEECRKIVAAREIRRQMARMKEAGSRAFYFSVDMRDEAATAEAVRRAVSEHGPIRGLVHGAGVLADKLISDKTAEQFDSVFDTKVAGLRHVLGAVDLRGLKVLALFSSSTARYGRLGQSDYAMANEALNKAAQLLARRLPGCRAVSINWGPWDGGMVTDGIKRLFESEGVPVIGLEAGSRCFVSELASDAPGVNTFPKDARDGLPNTAERSAEVVVLGGSPRAPAPSSRKPLQTVFERELSLEEHPFLLSHVINGKAVLPFAIISEWLGHAALHDNPGLVFHGFDDMRIFKGVLLNGERAYPVSVSAGKATRKEGHYAVKVELRGGPERILHAGAEIILAGRLPKGDGPRLRIAARPYPRTVERAYRDILFHGPDMRAVRSILGLSEEGVTIEAPAALPPQSWIRRPPRDRWLADPMALDAAFQAMILWTFEHCGAGSLPSRAAGYRQYRAQFPAEGVRIAARVVKRAENAATADIEFLDFQGELVARMLGYECTLDKSLNEAFRRNALEAVAS